MSTIGFKCSWIKENKAKAKVEETEQLPPLIPGTAVAFVLELQMKIQEHQEYMVTKEFTKLSIKAKTSIIETYTFLVQALATIQMPQNVVASGYIEYAQAEVDNNID
jgi:hypothetical protein